MRYGPAEAEQEVVFRSAQTVDGTDAVLLMCGIDIGLQSPDRADQDEVAADAWRRDKHPDYCHVDPIGAERLDAVEYFEISSGLSNAIRLQTGALAAPVAQLRRCAWNRVINGVSPCRAEGTYRAGFPR